MKLQIKNNNITLNKESSKKVVQNKNSLNEDATETFSNIANATGIKGIFKATKDVAKFVKDTSLTIYKVFGSLIANIWSKNGSMEDFAKRVKNIEKHFMDETNRAIQSLDNTTRVMIQEAGLDEKNIDMILASGLPIAALVESIQTKSYSPKLSDNPTYVEGKKALDVILANIVNIYLGNESSKEKITYNANVINVIKEEISKVMGKKFLAWIESINDNSKLSNIDKSIIQKITKSTRIENLKTLEGDAKKAEEIGNLIKNAYINATGVKESKFLLKILNNKINQEVLLEKPAELDKAQAVSSLDKLLKAVAFSLVFREKIINSVFNKLERLSYNMYNEIFEDLSTFAQYILIYNSHKEVINGCKENTENFNQDIFKTTLKNKMTVIKSFLHPNAVKATEEYANSIKYVENKESSNDLSFISYCNAVILAFTKDFEESGITNDAGKYYEQLKKYIKSIVNIRGVNDKSLEKTTPNDVDDNVIKLYAYLKDNKDELKPKSDISDIQAVIKAIEDKLSNQSIPPSQTSSDSSTDNNNDQEN